MQTLHPIKIVREKTFEEDKPTHEQFMIKSEDLFKSSDVIYIMHQTGVYLLRETKSGKLILTK